MQNAAEAGPQDPKLPEARGLDTGYRLFMVRQEMEIQQGPCCSEVLRLGKDAEWGQLGGWWEWARFTGVLHEMQGP